MGRLIDENDLEGTPAAVVHNAEGNGQVLLVCEHAANRIPTALDNLGLDEATRLNHIAWDPGALAVAQEISHILDARLVASTVSRLVYDCNRPPEAPGAMPKHSEVFDIPGNRNLSNAEKAARVATVYEPFRTLLADTIATSPKPPVMVTIHSFTPVYLGEQRDVEIGILHDSDTRLADAMLDLAPKHTELNARRNDPYGPDDGVTHTLKLHALPNGLMNVMIEVRNDLIATADQQQAIAKMLAELITGALAQSQVEQETQCRA
ncbi:N-formylglutamate amidohydrolase [Profundibacter sp.]|uniref:N-formylglutamate amidohydrolase n=1 Tax=Profundibacter sp. TaxID=3101071 RepID=UPI003D0DB223